MSPTNLEGLPLIFFMSTFTTPPPSISPKSCRVRKTQTADMNVSGVLTRPKPCGPDKRRFRGLCPKPSGEIFSPDCRAEPLHSEV